jgi:type I restriction enzyme M protein
LSQLEYIEAIEKRLWSAADTLRANSNYASNENFLPVPGCYMKTSPAIPCAPG